MSSSWKERERKGRRRERTEIREISDHSLDVYPSKYGYPHPSEYDYPHPSAYGYLLSNGVRHTGPSSRYSFLSVRESKFASHYDGTHSVSTSDASHDGSGAVSSFTPPGSQSDKSVSSGYASGLNYGSSWLLAEKSSQTEVITLEDATAQTDWCLDQVRQKDAKILCLESEIRKLKAELHTYRTELSECRISLEEKDRQHQSYMTLCSEMEQLWDQEVSVKDNRIKELEEAAANHVCKVPEKLSESLAIQVEPAVRSTVTHVDSSDFTRSAASQSASSVFQLKSTATQVSPSPVQDIDLEIDALEKEFLQLFDTEAFLRSVYQDVDAQNSGSSSGSEHANGSCDPTSVSDSAGLRSCLSECSADKDRDCTSCSRDGTLTASSVSSTRLAEGSCSSVKGSSRSFEAVHHESVGPRRVFSGVWRRRPRVQHGSPSVQLVVTSPHQANHAVHHHRRPPATDYRFCQRFMRSWVDHQRKSFP